MRKILVVISLFVIFIFLVSCAPQITDEELEAELAKLTPEEREALVKYLEAKEKSAFAGQAIAGKYGSNIARASTAQIVKVVKAFNCIDSDGDDPKVVGIAKKGGEALADTCSSDYELHEAYCDQNNNPSYKQYNCKLGDQNNICEGGRCKALSIDEKAAIFCAKPENVGKKTQYCSEDSTNIKYNRFRCISKPVGNVPVAEVDTTYKKSLLYPQVDSCPEILAQFLDQPEYVTIGCYDSDAGVNAEVAGHIEVIQLQTGNKAPTAPSAAAQPIKEVDACSGTNFYESVSGNQEGCAAGYSGEDYPPDEYTEISCVADIKGVGIFDIVGNKLFERKCPSLFQNPGIQQNTVIVNNCPYTAGYNCWNGKCDPGLPKITYVNNKEHPCKDYAKCLNVDHGFDTKIAHSS